MGSIVRIKSNQEKSALCEYLRNKGFRQRVSPYLNHGFSFNAIAVFDKSKSFYGLYSKDAEFYMEDETMTEMEYKQFKNKEKQNEIRNTD